VCGKGQNVSKQRLELKGYCLSYSQQLPPVYQLQNKPELDPGAHPLRLL
jgi:hypothetical protein